MKIFWKNKLRSKSVALECSFLNEEEMAKVRGGDRKIKPNSRPKDFYDDDED